MIIHNLVVLSSIWDVSFYILYTIRGIVSYVLFGVFICHSYIIAETYFWCHKMIILYKLYKNKEKRKN